MITYLVKADPEAAAQRLTTVPHEMRSALFQSISLSDASPAYYLSMVEIARRGLTASDSQRAIAHLSGSLPPSYTSPLFTSVTNFLDQIEASPAERKATVENIATTCVSSEVSSGKMQPLQAIESMRQWVSEQSPGSENTTTAAAVAFLHGQGKISLSDAVNWIGDVADHPKCTT